MMGRPNVVVLRTFSKAYGLAGFRVGYCVADPAVAAAVRAVSLPFGVSVAAQAAVIASLEAEALLFSSELRLASRRPGHRGIRCGLRLCRCGGTAVRLWRGLGWSADHRR